MSARVGIEFVPIEGALVRLLGLIERRGFEVRGVRMAERPCGRSATLSVDVSPRDPGRRLDVLEQQLRRLHGVQDITMPTAKAPA
ncbi:MAG: hypothetical protein AVDCRST_MAG39-2713 [uncultured Sphingomonadaceae bacterium]|uniref:Acetolactate synthase small subunit n=1 Tax=uncultured Sphingomonadaceae bacterium TaxID=169976 RepID=A0A6J4TJ73_9SPHN|nr:MAG: hypothetical protein AVDCRST_MAG39-2713 [uncultured Sphingomonadaceae bacterium]